MEDLNICNNLHISDITQEELDRALQMMKDFNEALRKSSRGSIIATTFT